MTKEDIEIAEIEALERETGEIQPELRVKKAMMQETFEDAEAKVEERPKKRPNNTAIHGIVKQLKSLTARMQGKD
jgi:hypothetical protein